ncbi:unnamed protein product, partial [Phaeothamnion confervicola]
TGVGDEVWVVCELTPPGSLRECLRRAPRALSDGAKRRILSEVAGGMAYLHSLDIQHRNLKASNVFLASDTTAKISDFGLSRTVAALTGTETGRRWQETAPWSAPEILQREGYVKESDVYSFGVVVWEILTEEV